MSSCEGLQTALWVEGARGHVLTIELTIERLPQAFQAHSARSVEDRVARMVRHAPRKVHPAGSIPAPVSNGIPAILV